MGKYYYTDLDKFDFSYLKNTRYEKVYEVLEEAKELHKKKDKRTCCYKLRYALEIIVSDILGIIGICKQKSINGDLKLIKNCVPIELRYYYEEDILNEMHNVRKAGNVGAHYYNSNGIDMAKAAHTSFIAMKKICKWLSDFENRYYSYIKEKARQEEEARRLKEEENRKRVERIKDVTIKVIKFSLNRIVPMLGDLMDKTLKKM